MNKIVMYSSNTCPHCQSAKKYLLGKGFIFEEKNVQENGSFRKELIDKGYRGVPVIIIDSIDIVGFDKDKIDQVLKI